MNTAFAEPSTVLPSIAATFYPAINYAFQQNAIPVIKELRFQYDGVARKDLVLHVSTEPAFSASAEIRRQIISAKPVNNFALSSVSIRRKMKP